MQVIRDPASLSNVTDPAIRQLIHHRIATITSDGPYDADLHGYFLVVEAGDTLEAINQQVGFDILTNRWTSLRWDHQEYTPAFEYIEEHQSCFEALYVRDDSGYAVLILFSKDIGIPEVIAMCQRFAVPGTPL
jgi:hypothetical protein